MYAASLQISDFKCFGKAELHFQYPGRENNSSLRLPNVNVIVGDNGGGKSSVLRALAIATLAPSLLHSGFVPYRMVRRPGAKRSGPKQAALTVRTFLDKGEAYYLDDDEEPGPFTRLKAKLIRGGPDNLDYLVMDNESSTTIHRRVFDDHSSGFFVVGFGTTRRTETGEFSESSARKSRSWTK